MQAIKLLSDFVINQIAAGEVIERPASVVKELVENAIDAQATEIVIHIAEGGKTLIRVTDNGHGMDAEGLKLCLQRHATSKITAAEDLIGVPTNGFRGEAIPSIASVAKLRIESRTATTEVGHSVHLNDQQQAVLNPVARPQGTMFVVEELFYNTPVRKNFLTSDSSETTRIVDVVSKIALAHPEIRFELSQKGRNLFTGVPGTPETRLAEVLGSKAAQNMHAFTTEVNGQFLQGFVMDPAQAQPKRSAQYIYLSRRPIWSPAIVKAVQRAYEPYGLKGSPTVVLFLELDANSYDVNVHPAKKEVRFSNESNIFTLVQRSITQALLNHSSTPVVRFMDSPETAVTPYAKPPTHFSAHPPTSHVHSPSTLGNHTVAQPHPPVWNEPQDAIPQDMFSLPEYGKVVPLSPQLFQKEGDLATSIEGATGNFLFFQWAQTYIVSEDSQGLIFVCQNAAHQRILYESALDSLQKNEAVAALELLFPEIFELSPTESQLLNQNRAILAQVGYHLEPFGGHTWKLRSIPAHIPVGQSATSFRKFMAELSAPDPKTAIEEIIAKAYAKGAAITAGTTLNNAEMVHLFEQLIQCREPFSSPFGNTTLMRLPISDINKKFGRA